MDNTKYRLISAYYFILITFLHVLSGCSTRSEPDIRKVVDSLSVRFVPDRRIALCNIKVKTDTNGAVILTGETTSNIAKQKIIKTLNDLGILLTDSVIILPDSLRNEKYSGLVCLSVINLRREPDHTSELVSQSLMGTPVHILKEEDSWCLVQTPDRYIAWTENTSIVPMNSSEMDDWKKSSRVIYTVNTGWLQEKPDEKSGIVGDMVAGCIMIKDRESGNYTKVILPDGRQGYIKKNELMDFDMFRQQAGPDGEKIIRYASSLTGIPYLWGGSSTKGADCSGFVQTVYFMNGIILMRDASLQSLCGEPVNITKDFRGLRIGDLLFFGSLKNSKPHVTHVAIYVGNGEFINSAGRVMVNSLDSAETNFSSYRFNTLLMARRILGVEDDPGIVRIDKHAWY